MSDSITIRRLKEYEIRYDGDLCGDDCAQLRVSFGKCLTGYYCELFEEHLFGKQNGVFPTENFTVRRCKQCLRKQR